MPITACAIGNELSTERGGHVSVHEAGAPRTTFAGQSNPRSNTLLNGWPVVVALLGCLGANAAATVTTAVVFFLFTRARVAPAAIAQIAIAATPLWYVYWTLTQPQMWGMQHSLITTLTGPNPGPRVAALWENNWPDWLAQQVPTGLLLGLYLGAGMTWWKLAYRTPEWSKVHMRRTPLQVLRGRYVASKLRHGHVRPKSGNAVGVLPTGRLLVQTDTEAGMHTSVTGATGSGKTSVLLNLSTDVVGRHKPLIMIDMKASPEVADYLQALADANGKRLWHFVLNPGAYNGPSPLGPAHYDPVGRGDYTRRKDLLMGAWLFQEEYYKTEVENYLQLAFKTDMLTNHDTNESTFARLARLLTPAYLRQMVESNPTVWDADEHLQLDRLKIMELTQNMSRESKSAIDGMSNKVQIIRSSVAGPAICADPAGVNTIQLYECCQGGDIVLFSLDAPQYPEQAKLIGRLIVQDLKTVESQLRRDPIGTQVHFMIDEYSKLGAENLLSLMNTCRDANMCGVLSTQGLADLRAVNDQFCDQLMGLINCHFVLRTATHSDAQYYAGLTGTERQYQEAYDIEMRSSVFAKVGVGSATGAGRVDVVEDFRIRPSVFQDLAPLRAVYLAAIPDSRRLYPVRIVHRHNRTATHTAPRAPIPPAPHETPAIPVDNPHHETVSPILAGTLTDLTAPAPEPELASPNPPIRDQPPTPAAAPAHADPRSLLAEWTSQPAATQTPRPHHSPATTPQASDTQPRTPARRTPTLPIRPRR